MKILSWSLVFMMAKLHSSELPKVTGEQTEYHHTDWVMVSLFYLLITRFSNL